MRRAITRIISRLLNTTRSPEDRARRLGVVIGRGCRIYITDWGSEPFLITIGDRVTVTSGVRFLTHDGATWLVRDVSGVRYQRFKPITVGDDVFIGVNSILMPGVRIGSRVIVGAGAVVTKDIPDSQVWAGNPARYICTFDEYCARRVSDSVLDSAIPVALSYLERVRWAVSRAPNGH